MTTIIVSMATKRFGFVETRHQEKSYNFNKREHKIGFLTGIEFMIYW